MQGFSVTTLLPRFRCRTLWPRINFHPSVSHVGGIPVAPPKSTSISFLSISLWHFPLPFSAVRLNLVRDLSRLCRRLAAIRLSYVPAKRWSYQYVDVFRSIYLYVTKERIFFPQILRKKSLNHQTVTSEFISPPPPPPFFFLLSYLHALLPQPDHIS